MPRGVRVVPAAWPTTVVHALLLAAAAFVVLAPDAAAQTTVTLTTGTGLTDDVTIRGGGYASVNYGASDELTTKQDSDPSYDRRALLKFDTQSTIPAGTAISSAHLYLTLKSPGGPTNRTLTAYRVTKSFLEREASWYNYRLGGAWASPGGDLAETFGTAAVGSVAGTVVDFDVTELVRRTVHGDFGSRYTRLALVDGGSALDDSYRGFWSSRASDTSKHPRLVITYGASDTTAPAVAVTSPAQGTTVSGSVALAASASDNVGVASVQFRVNGSNVGAADSSSPYTASWNTTGLAAGTYAVTALATDAAGNSTTSAGVSVTIAGSGSGSPTTVTLTSGTGLTDDVTIRGGTYGSVSFGASDELTTKQDTDPSFDRRALLKFDTENTIPVASSVSSAHLYLTLKSPGGPTNRMLTVYRVTRSFLQREATWYNYRLGGAWASPGGDLAETFGATAVGSVAGTVVDFDVTDLVRRTVDGDFGSRYTRLALVDDGTAADDGYRGFWSSRASDGSKHPRLVITYGGASTSDTTAPAVAVTSPAQGTTVSGTVALAAGASDNVGVASVQFRVNGSNVGAADSSSPYTASWNTTGLAAGTYTVTALATDAAGNSTTSAGVSVTIGDSGVVTNARSVTFSSSSQNATMADGRPVVSSYRLEIWTAGSNTAAGTPYRTSDMGKPSTSSTTLTIDQSTFFAGLARNQQFIATVSAIGPGGTARSDPSNVFVMP